MTEQKTVIIPACVEHGGFYRTEVTLEWVCPICGGPRGEVYKVRSYDGSRSMVVDGWQNPCGHIDSYIAVREEVLRQQREKDAKRMGLC